MIIGIDFDGVMVEHNYPDIGNPVPGAIEKVRKFIDDGHQIILWTMRSGDELHKAVKYMTDNMLYLYGG